MKYVVAMNSAALIIINNVAAPGEMIPEGISRFFVLGFFSSNFLSTSRLNPIAEFLANTMHRIIRRRSLRLNRRSPSEMPREKPIRANGMANTVWLNLTSEKYFLIGLNNFITG